MTIKLTPRESEVLSLLGSGLCAKEVANSIGCETKTVEVHRTNLMKKFGISDIVRLTHVGIRHGIVVLLKDDFEIEAYGETLKQHLKRLMRTP